MLAAESHGLAVRRHDLEPEHVVRREPVFQTMHAARVLGDVAADRARDLARRIGRVVEPTVRDRVADREIRDARLRDDAAVRVVDLEDPVEFAETQDDRIGRGHRAARERRAGAARHDFDALARRIAQDRGDLRRRLGQRDRERRLPVRRESIALVRGEPDRVIDHVVGAHERAQRARDLRAAREQRGIGCRHADHGRD